MERLLVMRLEAVGCAAEAWLNGLPLLRVGPSARVLSLPVHEFTLAGANELDLLIAPPPPGVDSAAPQPVMSDSPAMASLRLLLPRVGSVAHPSSARTLAQLDWVAPTDEVYEAPLRLQQRADLPIGFPRWRWLDAPVIELTPERRAEVLAYLQKIVIALAKGNPEPLVQASRLRLESLALAYQRKLADEVGRMRLQVQQAHAAMPLRPTLPTPDSLWLRPVAQGRLLECLGRDGLPALRCPHLGGGLLTWPLRLGFIDGVCYGLA